MFPILFRLTGAKLDFLLEIIFIALFPIALFATKDWLVNSNIAKVILFFLVLFLLLALVSSAVGRGSALPFLYQITTNLKVFMILAFGFFIAWSNRTERYFWKCLSWLWLPLCILVLLQWFMPGQYASIFRYGDPGGSTHFLGLPSKALGIFHNTSILAMFAGLFFLFCIAKARILKESKYYVISLAYLFLLIASGERQEIAAVIVTLGLILGLSSRHKPYLKAFAISTICTSLFATTYFVIAEDNILNTADRWGMSEYQSIKQPRAVMYEVSFEIANQNFPFGSGLGTFASAGAGKFDLSYYFELGFTSFNWFLKKNVLFDTYWPKFIAETGWIGFGAFLMIYIFLLLYTIRITIAEHNSELKLLKMMAFAGIATIFLSSPTSPALDDPTLTFFAMIFLGIAYNKSRLLKKDS